MKLTVSIAVLLNFQPINQVWPTESWHLVHGAPLKSRNLAAEDSWQLMLPVPPHCQISKLHNQMTWPCIPNQASMQGQGSRPDHACVVLGPTWCTWGRGQGQAGKPHIACRAKISSQSGMCGARARVRSRSQTWSSGQRPGPDPACRPSPCHSCGHSPERLDTVAHYSAYVE